MKVMQPLSPSLFLLGGAKFETKMPLVEKYLNLYDQVFVGGALTNDVLKARGYEVGTSLVSDVSLVGAPFLWSEKLLLPVDVIVDGPSGKDLRDGRAGAQNMIPSSTGAASGCEAGCHSIGYNRGEDQRRASPVVRSARDRG